MNSSEAAETMKIAWRYQNQDTTKSSNLKTSQRRHTFNLLKTIPVDQIERSDIQICDIEPNLEDDSWRNSSYFKLLQQIQSKVQAGGFLIDPNVQQDHRNLLRLGIQSLGSSQWGELEQTASRDLATFL